MIFPWQDRDRSFSWLKAGTTFASIIFAPAIWLVRQVATGEFGPVPLGGMTYWSGLWATALLLAALAATPAQKILGWRQLINVRRMIGVTALAYALAHIVIYFALRFWNFANIAHEMATRVSLIIASVATIGLIALGATSLDAAIARMGAKGWTRLHATIYLIAALALIHYLLSPDTYPEQFLLTGMFFWLMVWRALERRGLGTDLSGVLYRRIRRPGRRHCSPRCSSRCGCGRCTATSRWRRCGTTSRHRPRRAAGLGDSRPRPRDRGGGSRATGVSARAKAARQKPRGTSRCVLFEPREQRLFDDPLVLREPDRFKRTQDRYS